MNQKLLNFLEENGILEISLPLLQNGYNFIEICNNNVIVFDRENYNIEYELLNTAKYTFKSKGYELVLLKDLAVRNQHKKNFELIENKVKALFNNDILFTIIKNKYSNSPLPMDWKQYFFINYMKISKKDIKVSYDIISKYMESTELEGDLIMNYHVLESNDYKKIPNIIKSLVITNNLYRTKIQYEIIPEIIISLYNKTTRI